MEAHGATIKVVSIPLFKYVLPYHYSLLPSEAASNMARYDGIRYGYQPELFENSHNSAIAEDPQAGLFNYISRTKTAAFGMNVKRRVVLGNFLMSSGQGMEDFNKNLINAQVFRRMVIEQYMEEIQRLNIDFVISPTGFGEKPPKISDVIGSGTNEADNQESKSPVFEYKMDYFTVVSNCLGTPNLTVPVFENEEAKVKYDNFPTSIRCMGYFGEDYHLLRIGQRLEKMFEMNGMSAK